MADNTPQPPVPNAPVSPAAPAPAVPASPAAPAPTAPVARFETAHRAGLNRQFVRMPDVILVGEQIVVALIGRGKEARIAQPL